MSTRNKKVCWVQHASEHPLFMSIARALEKRNVASVFVCKTRTAHDAYTAEGFESYFISNIFNEFDEITHTDLIAYGEKYSSPSIDAIEKSDMHLEFFFKNKEKNKQKLIVRAYQFWEQFLKEHAIDAFVVRETATFATRTAYVVARKQKIPYGQLVIGPGENLIALCDVDESAVWSGLLKAVKKGSVNLTKNEEQLVDDFVNRRITQSKGGLALRFVPLSFFKTLREYVGMWFYDSRATRAHDPIRAAALQYGRYKLMKKLLWKYVTKPMFSYDAIHEDEKFVYFPIYSGEETSYLVNDPKWARQEVALIKIVADALPEGYKLYTKEHPFNPGDLTYQELQELNKVENIRVLHPLTSSHTLIKNSSAVAVLQGTTGWEAFIARRPVVSLSRPFFSYSSLVYKVSDMTKLPSVLQKAIENGDAIYRSKENEWKWFIHRTITTAGRGTTVYLKKPYGFATDEENANSIAEYIVSHLL